MIARHSLIGSSKILMASAIIAASTLIQPMGLRAATAPAPAAAADANQAYYGLLNDDNVYIRSGPSDERFYATAKLSKGAKVTVVAAKDDWLKIIPPEGSFCYVAKAYVEKRGDGTVGRVTKPDLNVRAGSTLNTLKTTVQTSLEEGDDVKIVGEESEYFKIAPPPGAYLYVKKTFVDPMPNLATATPPPTVSAPATPPHMNYPIPSEPIPPAVVIAPTTTQPTPSTELATTAKNTVAPTTAPSEVVTAPPTTQAVETSAEVKFGQLEDEFLEANKLPMDQQPIDKLLVEYKTLASDVQLPSSMKQLADRRLMTLKVRVVARKNKMEAQKMEAENKARLAALTAEKNEIDDRIKATKVTSYSAVGTLRISSLQQTGPTMYRLTDPNTGRTLVYIRSNDEKYAGLLNKFIGVNGDITEDSNMNLKVITPKSSEEVDMAKVNDTVTATVIPPSLLIKTSTASTAGN